MQLLSLPPYLPPSELFQPGSGGEKIIFKSCLDFFLQRCICHTALKWVGVLRLKSLSECASDSTALCSIKPPTVDIASDSVCFWCESIPRQGGGSYNSYHDLYDSGESVQLWPFWAQVYSGWYARLFAFYATLFCDMLDIYFWHIGKLPQSQSIDTYINNQPEMAVILWS